MKHVIYFLISALVILALFNPLTAGYYREIIDLREQLELTRSEKDELAAFLAGAAPIGAESEILSADKERLETLFPLEKELPFALVELEKKIKSYPLELISFRTGEKRYHHNHGLILVSLAATGPPAAAKSFLGRVAGLPRFFVFDSITWACTGAEEVRLDLELELYFIIPEQAETYPGLVGPGKLDH